MMNHQGTKAPREESTQLALVWHCWTVAHGGEGPGRLHARDVKKRSLGANTPLPIDAREAAELYAERLFEDEGYCGDGESLYVGVAAERDRRAHAVYQCTCRVRITAEAVPADWIKPEALQP